MSRWDELERAVKDCKRMVAHYGVSNFADHVNPDVVLTLIEQNRELLEALREIHNEVEENIEPTVRDLVNQCGRNTPTNPNEIYGYCERIEEIIRKATGE